MLDIKGKSSRLPLIGSWQILNLDAYYEVSIPQADTNGDNEIDFDEFMTIFKTEKSSFGDFHGEKSFQKFDKNDDGFISMSEFKRKIKSIMKKLGQDMTNDEIKDAFKFADSNEDGKISLDEFEAIPNRPMPKACPCWVWIIIMFR